MNHYRRHPADPSAWFSEEEITRAAAYRRPLRRAALTESMAALTGLFVVVAAHGAGRLVRVLGVVAWPVQMVAVTAALVVAGFVLGLPFAVWRLHHERRWELSHESAGTWVADRLKELLLSLVLADAVAVGFWTLIRTTSAWWIYGWAAAVALMVLLATVAQALFAPMFNTFRPLDDPWLLEHTVELGRRVGVRIRQVFVMDASRRTAKHNAYFTGLGRTKRVVLWDTLLADYDRSAALGVLAHELGHWRRRHVPRMLALTATVMAPGFLLLHALLGSARVGAWAGIRGGGDPAALPLVILAISAMQALWLPVTQWISRAWERQADLDAVEMTGDPRAFAAMQRDLAVRNLSDLAPSRLAYALAGHPPAAERMALIEAASSEREEPVPTLRDELDSPGAIPAPRRP